MDQSRRILLQRLREADRHGRFSAWAPRTAGGRPIIVHSKVSMIDDRLMQIGSANLNNRSGGFDTECDVALVAESPWDATSRLIASLRARLLGHFIGVEAEAFERAYSRTGRVARAIEELDGARRLRPLADPPTLLSGIMAEWQLGDPTSPEDSWRPWRREGLAKRLRRLAAETKPEAVGQGASSEVGEPG
jgi:phosphatidylserine/phosphatidylglycerophosphate/cardiolipin synthase-like enzyme